MDRDDLTRLLAALSEHGLRFYTAADAPEGPAPAVRPAHAFYHPHAHDQLELICLLEGELALHVNRRWGLLGPLRTRVFMPGTIHGEHYVRPDQSYRMLWATVFPASLFFHLTAYSPLLGYTTSGKRLAITPPRCAALWQAARAPDLPADPRLRAQFHFLLMECLHHTLAAPRETDLRTADYHERMVEQVKQYVTNYYWEDISLKKLAGLVHYSPGHLNAVFRRAERVPLHRFITEVRMRRARQLLAGGELLVKQVAQAVGYGDPLYFSRVFAGRYGRSPAAAREEADGTSRAPRPASCRGVRRRPAKPRRPIRR